MRARDFRSERTERTNDWAQAFNKCNLFAIVAVVRFNCLAVAQVRAAAAVREEEEEEKEEKEKVWMINRLPRDSYRI